MGTFPIYSQVPNKRPFLHLAYLFSKKFPIFPAFITQPPPPLLNFQFLLRKTIFLYTVACCLYCFKKFNGSCLVFNSVYFSLKVNISFQLSIYQVMFLNLKSFFFASEHFSFSINYNFVCTQENFDTFTSLESKQSYVQV